jgi:hypothetical protein
MATVRAGQRGRARDAAPAARRRVAAGLDRGARWAAVAYDPEIEFGFLLASAGRHPDAIL